MRIAVMASPSGQAHTLYLPSKDVAAFPLAGKGNGYTSFVVAEIIQIIGVCSDSAIWRLFITFGSNGIFLFNQLLF
jgi:hypothetical protein